MIELRGAHNTAKVFTDNIDEATVSQVINLCNQEFTEDSIIRIMPDCHKGMGCTIGTTMTITDKVVPNLVGVDIGCGVLVAKLLEKSINFAELDKVIHEHIPAGFAVRKSDHQFSKAIRIKDLRCAAHVNIPRAILSIGTLGGGNHFIELDVDDEGNYYLLIHTGSRNMGKQIAEFYQDLAWRRINDAKKIKEKIVAELKAQGREKEIETTLTSVHVPKVAKDLAYVQGQDFDDYMHDMDIAQKYAVINRMAILQEITSVMDLTVLDVFTTIHNYIDMGTKILRKGAVSAKLGEKLVIPINMRDGALLCVGKGNDEWNQSAPHGAGRILARGAAKRTLSMEAYQESMQGIFTTSVDESTLDEAPMAYKPMEEIMENIVDTVEVVKVIKPVYNFKAGGE